MLESEGGKQCDDASYGAIDPELCHQQGKDYQETTSQNSLPPSNKVENSTGTMNSTKDKEDSSISQALAVPIYAVPENVKSKVSFVKFHWCAWASEENSILT